MTNTDRFMRQALELARQGEGRTAPNPPVGAVLVRDGDIVGQGFHPGAGQPHAEIFALGRAGSLARGATLFVTLEPCCHQGRTGPCTEALIRAGVREVVVATLDPNPVVAGQGIARLQAAGLVVKVGVLEESCRQLLAPFAKHVTTGLPFVLFKAAMTLDGCIATSTGDSRWISCEKSRELVHLTRNRADGILVGSGTVIADNPRLTTRLETGGRNAARIVIDSKLQTSPRAEVYSAQAAGRRILVTSTRHDHVALEPYTEQGVEILGLPCRGDFLDPVEIIAGLGRLELMFVLLEGGGRLAGTLLRAGLIDRIMLFIAPRLLGGDDGRPLLSGVGQARLSEAWRLINMQSRQVDQDILIEGEVAPCLPD